MRTIKTLIAALMILAGTVANAQNITVKGTVKDSSNGEAVPFASVVVKGTTTGTTADAEGNYTLSVAKDGILVISSIGYQALEVKAADASKTLTLDPDSQYLDDVIVVAFGTTTRESFTGSAAVVKSEDIKKTQSPDVTRVLEGRVAGVQMTTSTGTLGSSPSIRIRGISSINAGNSPLIILDGVPYSGDMNQINTADIESVNVLKDAASNALYGARGANGVIMITTKKASMGKINVSLDAKLGWNTKAIQDYDVYTDPASYYEAYAGVLYNTYRHQGMSAYEANATMNQNICLGSKYGGLGYVIYNVPAGENLIGTNGKLNPNATLGRVDGKYLMINDNWNDETYRQSLRQEYNVNVTGGNDKISILGSFGYLDDKGIIPNADMYRFTGRLKADVQATKWLRLGGNFGYARYNYNNGNSSEGSGESIANIFGFASHIAPIYPVYVHNADGSIAVDARGNKIYDYGAGKYYSVKRSYTTNANPISDAINNVHNSEGNQFTQTSYAEVKFLKDFTFTFNSGSGIQETRKTTMCNPYYGQFAETGGYVTKSHGRFSYLSLQEILNWDKVFAGKHHATIMIGHEYYKEETKSLSASKSGLFSIENLELNGCAIDSKSAASSSDWYNNEGWFGRALYDFDGRYFISGSYRRDASSRFAPQNRWGNFWSAGAAWNINKEKWFSASWVDLLKIKASIGSQGNDNIGQYRYTDTYSVGMVNDQISVAFSDKGNENITWETNTNINAGVDFDLFKGRLSGSAEYFYRKTSDMVFFFSTPKSIGYSGYYDNIGDMSNTGVEITLNGTVIKTSNFKWDLYANATSYANKVISLPEKNKIKEVDGHKGFTSGNKFIGEGLPLNTFYMANYEGVDIETGLPKYTVVNEDGTKTTTTDYSSASDMLVGNVTPKLYGGFGTSLSFYGFDVSLSFNYSIGGLTYDSGYASLVAPPISSTGGNFHKDIENAWTVDNPNADFPRLEFGDKNNIASSSTRFLVDASYLNFQNAQIGYTLPAKITNKINISKLRIYVTCDNVFYWSYRKGLDPRYSFNGSTNSYVNSPVRTLSGGINLTF